MLVQEHNLYKIFICYIVDDSDKLSPLTGVQDIVYILFGVNANLDLVPVLVHSNRMSLSRPF